MTDDRDDPPAPGEQPLNELGWNPSVAEEVLGFYLLWQHEPNMGSGIYAAFEALSVIGRHAEAQEGGDIEPGPDGTIKVPWWVLKILAMGWAMYLADRDNQSLGRVLGLERKRGQRRITTELETLHRNLMITLYVIHRLRTAEERESSVTVEKAVEEAAKAFVVGEETAWAAYKEHHEQVTRRYEVTVAKT